MPGNPSLRRALRALAAREESGKGRFVFLRLQTVDFLKIDIEGAENPVLKDLDIHDKFKFIQKGIIEFHCIEGNSMAFTMGILEKNNLQYRIKSCDKDAVIISFRQKP